MVQTLSPHHGKALVGLEHGNPRPIKAEHLDGSATLREGQKTVIWEKQVPADKLAWWGYGFEDLPGGVKTAYADLVDSGGADIEADISIRITDSSGNVTKAQRELGDAGTLREMQSEDPSEREEMPAMDPHAEGHRKLQVVAVAETASDGSTIDPSASSCRFWHTQTV